MLDLDKQKHEWDDLDIYDREAANIRRALRIIDLNQWVKDLHSLDPDLYDNLKKLFDTVSGRQR